MNLAANVSSADAAARFRGIAESFRHRTPTGGFAWDAWRALSDAGLWRLPVPEKQGGAGGTWTQFVEAFEAIVSTLRSVGFAMALANQATLIRALLTHGSPAQCDRLLPRLMSGAAGATAISEKGTGTEVRALETRLTADADGYRLDGHKYNISHAPDAQWVLVVASYTNGDKRATALVLLDPAREGVSRTPPQETFGVADLPIGDMTFKNVAIGKHELLGEPAAGLRLLMDIASMNRALFGLLCADVVKPFLTDALAYAASRATLGTTLDQHQHVQRRLVEIEIGVQRTRSMALAALDQLLSQHPAALANCSIAKLGGARDLAQAALHLLAIHGSDGYRRGALATFVADALAMGSAGGTEEMHSRNIFSQMQRAATTTAGMR